MEQYPKFSVIIPQKNREEYLGYTLRTCMIQDYPNFEIIVSDDCSDDNSVELVRGLAKIDQRIKLFAHEAHLGMHDNFEFALNQVKEGYVIVLGGDDGLTPGCIWRMYELFKETKTELLTWDPAIFVYPEGERTTTTFCVRRCRKKELKKLYAEDFFNKLTKDFRYIVSENPMIYVKGCASLDLINRVKARTKDGCFYYCPTPDGYSGIVLAGEAQEYYFTNEPLSIIGTTPKSQGANYQRNDKKSREEATQFFNDNVRRTMHEQLASQPYSPLVTLMSADYLLTANDLPGWPGKFKMFTMEHLIRKTFDYISNINYAPEVLGRELRIVRNIAVQHNLTDLFDELMQTTKKRIKNSSNIKGVMITRYLQFDGTEIGINNIFDASIATPFVFNSYSLFNFKQLGNIISNTLKFLINRKRYKVQDLPKIDFNAPDNN